jgi:glycosyltransferase involved in cell wall biosynthesis
MATEEIENPLVSVILPVYNGSKYLKDAIDSVLGQTYPHIEILVINDGSTDDSQKIIDAFGPNIRAFKQENQGVAAARNFGIAKAKGQFIAFLDQDDYYPLDRFKLLVSSYKDTKKLISMGLTQFVFENELSKLRWPNLPENNLTFIKLLGSGIFHKSIFNNYGNFIVDLKSGEDIEWFHRLNQLGIEIYQSNDVVLFYRQHSANVSADKQTTEGYLLKSLKYILDAKRNNPTNKG